LSEARSLVVRKYQVESFQLDETAREDARFREKPPIQADGNIEILAPPAPAQCLAFSGHAVIEPSTVTAGKLLAEAAKELTDLNLQQGVGMLVTPTPVSLLIVVVELGKRTVFAMIFFRVDTIRLIFMTVPFMIVIVLFVVVGLSRLVILGSQH
jgi:hypothetical protein